MSATTVTTTCLKRKRDWADAREDDEGCSSTRVLRSTASKRARCIVDITNQIAGNDNDNHQRIHSKRRPLHPISSCRNEPRRRTRLPPPPSPRVEEVVHAEEEPMSEVEPSTPSPAETIEPTPAPTPEPIEPESPSPPALPFGFDTTLSNVQYGFLKNRPYRFSSPLAPSPEPRKRAKRRSSRYKIPTPLLKSTLHRNHLNTLRQRFPELFMPRSPTHPDAIPQLDDDDDEFDDDEEDEIIDDFDDDDNSQVEDIVDLYSRGATPEPEPIPMLTKEAPISMPETIIHLTPSSKPRPRPLQLSNVLNIRPAELAPPKLSLVTCEVVG